MKTEETSGGTSTSPQGEIPPVKEPEKEKSPSKFSLLARKVGLWLLFLAIGALAVTLAVYLPTQTKLNQAQSEVDRLQTIEQEYNDLLPKYNLAESQVLVYKTISDTILLREALTASDTTRVNQQLRYIEDDLSKLTLDQYPEILQRLQSQFSKISSTASGNASEALAQLEIFYKDLLLLADNLQ